jgi:hypothetical protein
MIEGEDEGDDDDNDDRASPVKLLSVSGKMSRLVNFLTKICVAHLTVMVHQLQIRHK